MTANGLFGVHAGEQPHMKSNGYGSLCQDIHITVKSEFADQVADLLGTGPESNCKDSGLTHFQWSRWTTISGDDESIVFELFQRLGGPTEFGWNIDWDKSDY